MSYARFFGIILFFPITKYLCVQYCVALLLIMHEFWCDLILPCVFPIFPYASRSSIIFPYLSVDLEYYLSGKPSNKSLWSALFKKKHYYHRCRYVDTFFSVSWNNYSGLGAIFCSDLLSFWLFVFLAQFG